MLHGFFKVVKNLFAQELFTLTGKCIKRVCYSLAKKLLDKYIKVYQYTKYAIFIANPPLLYLALI